MSIYCSFSDFGEDDTYPAPLVYRGSHLLPAPGDRRGGSLDLGLIPGFITQDGWCVHGHDHAADNHGTDALECEPYDELPAVWPYLRVGLAVDDAGDGWQCVVLDRAQVATLRDQLTGWLERTLQGNPTPKEGSPS